MTYSQLRQRVASIASALRACGVRKGDRVVGYLPNCTLAVEAMLAASSIGAVWSSTSPDFGVTVSGWVEGEERGGRGGGRGGNGMEGDRRGGKGREGDRRGGKGKEGDRRGGKGREGDGRGGKWERRGGVGRR